MASALLMGLVSSCSIPGTKVETEASESTSAIYTTVDYSEMLMQESETIVETTSEDLLTPEEATLLFLCELKGDLLGYEISEDSLLEESGAVLNGNLTIKDFVTSVINSSEFEALELDDEAYINRVGSVLFNGQLSEARSEFLLAQLQNGVPREAILNVFMGSEPFIELCNANGFFTDNSITLLDSTSDLYDVVNTIPEGEIITTTNGYLPSDSVLDEINDALSTLDSHYQKCGFMLIDINTGRGIAYNVDHKFYSASSIKGPYVTSLCYYIPETLTTYESTIHLILKYSDNDAFASIFNRYLRTYITSWAEESGVPAEAVCYKYPQIETRNLFRMWIRSYEYFTTSEDGETLATWFEEPEYSAIHSTLGDLYVTQTKGGWMIDDQPNHTTTVDAGIVYATNGEYIIVIESNIPRNMDGIVPLVTALNHAHDEMTYISTY